MNQHKVLHLAPRTQRRHAGVAPAARLVILDASIDDYDDVMNVMPDDLTSGVFEPFWKLGSRVTSNSWDGGEGVWGPMHHMACCRTAHMSHMYG